MKLHSSSGVKPTGSEGQKRRLKTSPEDPGIKHMRAKPRLPGKWCIINRKRKIRGSINFKSKIMKRDLDSLSLKQ